jgi:hypothetical protein
MFIFTGHRPMMDKLSNTQYEQTLPKRSGASEAPIHTHINMYIQVHRHTAFQKLSSSIQGSLKLLNLSKSQDQFFHHRNTS